MLQVYQMELVELGAVTVNTTAVTASSAASMRMTKYWV
jgi:hypothetical protein